MSTTYNPFDPEQVDKQDEVLDRLRREAAVVELMPGFFYLSRHEDIVAVSRDPVTFPQAPFSPLGEQTRDPDQLQLGESNPPWHGQIRKILQSVLSPPRIRAIAPFVDQVCAQLADAVAVKESADLIADLGRPLPAAVIGHLTGVPEADRSFLHEYSDLVVQAVQEQDQELKRRAQEKVDEFDEHFLELIQDRRASGARPDDAMTALIEYRDENGVGLSDEKILLHLTKDLVTGGIDTTTHLVGNLFYDLLTTDGAYRRVREDRRLVPTAVEEALRHRPVVNLLFRQPPNDVELHGVRIPGGSIVALGYASACRDEAMWERGTEFSLDRGDAVRRHLGFGWGVHLCVGAPLARVEGSHLLEAVLDRVPAMSLAPGFAYQRVKMFMMRGPVRLDVVLGGATDEGGPGGAGRRRQGSEA
jgi:cytochrome P450